MTLITQGKTNWKYLSAIFLLALLVGVISFVLKNHEREEEIKEIDSLITYKNKEAGIEFNYPEWGELTESFNEEQLEAEIYHFIPEKEKVKQIWYHQPSETLAFVERGIEYESFDLGKVHQETLKIINPSGEIVEVYTFSPEQASLHYRFKGVSFSPNGQYINIIVALAGYNRGPVLFDIESKDVIFGKFIKPDMQEIFYYNPYKDVYWSKNSKVFAVKSYIQSKGGGNSKDGLFVSDYNDVKRVNKIFSSIDKHDLNPMIDFQLYDLVDIYFDDDQNLFFTEKSEELNKETKYQYCLERKKLEIIE